MKITPKPVDNSVNVTKDSLFAIVTNAVFKFSIIIVGSYLAIGALTDLVVRNYPETTNRALRSINADDKIIVRLGKIVEKPDPRIFPLFKALAEKAELGSEQPKLVVVESKVANAVALPGSIVIFSGLLKDVKSENELAMVIAHEIGHHKNSDIVRAIARDSIFSFMLQLAFDDLSFLDSILGQPLELFRLSYSREHEAAADEFALELLNRHYGHVGGSTDFFRRIGVAEEGPLDNSFLSTHPLSENRVARLIELAATKGYYSRAVNPW